LTRVAGTPHTFRASTRVPRWVGTGTWKPYLVRVEDRVGNAASYGSRRLSQLGFDRDLSVVGRADTEQPQLKRLSLNPAAVDVRVADDLVTVKVRAIDAQSGVWAVEATFWGQDFGSGPNLRRVAGTRRDGIWRGVYQVPRCTPQAGALRASIHLTDGSGRARHYRSTSLAALGWPHSITVTADDHTAPLAFVRPSTPLAGPITVSFSEHVNGIDSTSATVRRNLGNPELDADPATLGPILPGSWVCKDAREALTDCETGRVVSARFRPTDPLAASSYYAVTLNPEFSLGVTDLAGNPVIAEDLTVYTRP
jgi:hypothetical protein